VPWRPQPSSGLICGGLWTPVPVRLPTTQPGRSCLQLSGQGSTNGVQIPWLIACSPTSETRAGACWWTSNRSWSSGALLLVEHRACGGQGAGVGEPCAAADDCAAGLVCEGRRLPAARTGRRRRTAGSGRGRRTAAACLAGRVLRGGGAVLPGGRASRTRAPARAARPARATRPCVEGVCAPFGRASSTRDVPAEPEPLGELRRQRSSAKLARTVRDRGADSRSVRVPPLVGDLDGDDVPRSSFAAGWTQRIALVPAGFVAIRVRRLQPVWTSDHSQDFKPRPLALAM